MLKWGLCVSEEAVSPGCLQCYWTRGYERAEFYLVTSVERQSVKFQMYIFLIHPFNIHPLILPLSPMLLGTQSHAMSRATPKSVFSPPPKKNPTPASPATGRLSCYVSASSLAHCTSLSPFRSCETPLFLSSWEMCEELAKGWASFSPPQRNYLSCIPSHDFLQRLSVHYLYWSLVSVCIENSGDWYRLVPGRVPTNKVRLAWCVTNPLR